MTRRERGASYWPRAGATGARPRRDFGRWRAPRRDPRSIPPPPARRRPQDRFAPPPQSLALRPRRGPRTVSPKVGTSSSKYHPAPFGATPERSRRSRPPNNTGNTPRRRRTVSAVVAAPRARARAGTCRRARRVAAATWPQNWGVRRAARRPRRGVGRRRNRRPRRGADFATPRKPTKSARDDEMGRRRPRSGAGLDVGTGAGSGRGAAAPQTACPGVNVDLSRRAAARRPDFD